MLDELLLETVKKFEVWKRDELFIYDPKTLSYSKQGTTEVYTVSELLELFKNKQLSEEHASNQNICNTNA